VTAIHLAESNAAVIVSRMGPKDVVTAWVDAFNRADARALADLYLKDAVNHPVANEPAKGRDAIRAMFEREFASGKMTCQVENLFEDGAWAVLEWRDPRGLRGCGVFRIENNKIALQRGYWGTSSRF
jgi:limonene-1,2-epoxide hydrolase